MKKTNRFLVVRALAALILALSACSFIANAQTPQRPQLEPVQTQPTPLVTETKSDGGRPKVVWELRIPQRPDDHKTLLDYRRMFYGLALIQEDSDKLQKFIDEYIASVKPGAGAWSEAEKLVMLYTNSRAQTDPLAEVNPLDPSRVHILTTAEEIRKFTGLDPDKDFKEMDWQKDPVGKCVTKDRADLLNNADSIEAQTRRVYYDNPTASEATIKAFRDCAHQKEDSATCYDAEMRNINFLDRNHGANSTGQNESYLKGTNRPNARATIYWVEGVGWKGNGWECCGNFLEFYTSITIPVDAFGSLRITPQTLACSLDCGKIVLSSRTDSTVCNLAIAPAQKSEDFVTDWFFAGQRIAGGNTVSREIQGSQVPNPDTATPLKVDVTVGQKTASCSQELQLHLPSPPPLPLPVALPPSCTLDVAPPVIRNVDDQWRVRIQESNPDNMLYAAKTTVAFAGSNQPVGYQPPQAMEFSGTRADFGQFQGVVTFIHTLTGADGSVLNSCAGKLATQQAPTEETKKRFCGPIGVYCWLPPVIAGAAIAGYKMSHKTCPTCGKCPACSGGPGATPNPIP
jgi:hypothetical protein